MQISLKFARLINSPGTAKPPTQRGSQICRHVDPSNTRTDATRHHCDVIIYLIHLRLNSRTYTGALLSCIFYSMMPFSLKIVQLSQEEWCHEVEFRRWKDSTEWAPASSNCVGGECVALEDLTENLRSDCVMVTAFVNLHCHADMYKCTRTTLYMISLFTSLYLRILGGKFTPPPHLLVKNWTNRQRERGERMKKLWSRIKKKVSHPLQSSWDSISGIHHDLQNLWWLFKIYDLDKINGIPANRTFHFNVPIEFCPVLANVNVVRGVSKSPVRFHFNQRKLIKCRR